MIVKNFSFFDTFSKDIENVYVNKTLESKERHQSAKFLSKLHTTDNRLEKYTRKLSSPMTKIRTLVLFTMRVSRQYY